MIACHSGRYQLTPLYGVLSTHPVLGEGPARISPFRAKMATVVSSKNAHWKMRDILRRHWLALGTRHGILTADGRDTARLIDETVSEVPEAIDRGKARLPQGVRRRARRSHLWWHARRSTSSSGLTSRSTHLEGSQVQRPQFRLTCVQNLQPRDFSSVFTGAPTFSSADDDHGRRPPRGRFSSCFVWPFSACANFEVANRTRM